MVKPFLTGAVKTEDAKPTLAENRLHPIGFFASRGLRAEVEINAAVSVFSHLGIALVVLLG